MARGTFNGSQSGSTFDHGISALQRWHDARRQEAERAERAESWIADQLVGRTFHSFDAVLASAVGTYETLVSRSVTTDERDILTRAARACWCGLSQRARTRIALTASGHVESITFYRAA